EIQRASRQLGRTVWRNRSGSHLRSRVETKMNCVKLLGQRLMSRNFDRQVAVLNRFTVLGIPVTVAAG
ncbi:IS5/IS1182 family transposase, partial [Rhodovulum sulfidophilum]|nr:IS5/IS1182 family transposase [Rhodovulum sulfidophilum]